VFRNTGLGKKNKVENDLPSDLLPFSLNGERTFIECKSLTTGSFFSWILIHISPLPCWLYLFLHSQCSKHKTFRLFSCYDDQVCRISSYTMILLSKYMVLISESTSLVWLSSSSSYRNHTETFFEILNNWTPWKLQLKVLTRRRFIL
jgi:hypothetical protein